MSELRYNLISGEWVIIATDRAKRPSEFSKSLKDKVVLPEFKNTCPFCPGNEAQTPSETFRLGDKTSWKVRVTYNKFSALNPDGGDARVTDGLFKHMQGFGVHEVIIEHPRHNAVLPLMKADEVADVIRVYKARSLAIQQMNHIEAIVIFKNHGAQAGTSLEHPHSQLIATPIVPPQLRGRLTQAVKYFDDTGTCMFCQTLKEELSAGKRIVAESRDFVSFIPYAALTPFHLWIFPRKHDASFVSISEEECIDLAGILKVTLSKLYHGLDNPDFNITVHSSPIRERCSDSFHWYISIIPRVTKLAGFELGSGMFINVALPEESAEFLRGVRTP